MVGANFKFVIAHGVISKKQIGANINGRGKFQVFHSTGVNSQKQIGPNVN